MSYRIGQVKGYDENAVYSMGDEFLAPIVITDNLNTTDYDDITSIENWDKYKSYTTVDIVRDGMTAEVDSIGWVSLTQTQKEIVVKWFIVDKNLRDEVYTDEEQKDFVNRLVFMQKSNKIEDYSDIYNSPKADIDNYLSVVKKSNFIKSTEYSSLYTSAVNTSSTTFTEIPDIVFTDVSIGTYFLNFSCMLSGPNNSEIVTAIYINDVLLTGSEMEWESNNGAGNSRQNRTTHGYINYPISIENNSDISIRWKTSSGTANARTRTFSLIKI